MTNYRSLLTKLIGSLVILVLVIIGWFIVVHPRLTHASRVQSQVAAAQARNAGLRAQVDQLDKKQRDVSAEEAIAKKLAVRFPATTSESQLFNQIDAAAAKAGLDSKNVTSIQPGTPTVLGGADAGGDANSTPAAAAPANPVSPGNPASPGEVASMTVAISASGTPAQLGSFLRALENMPRAFLINNVQLSEGTSNTIAVNGTMFVLNPPAHPSVAATGPASSAPVAPTGAP